MNKLKQLMHRLHKHVRPSQPKEQTVENNVTPFIYTEEQLMARLKFFIGVCLAMTLTGIVFVVLYSLIFVTQPLNAISPIDQKFFELIVPIATFLTGTLSGIMLAGGDKDAQKMALQAATRPTPVSPPPSSPTTGGFGSASTTLPSSGSPAFGSPASNGFGAASTGFGAVSTPSSNTAGFGGGFGGPTQQPTFTASGKKIIPDEPQPLL
jgi:hypothetical protein